MTRPAAPAWRQPGVVLTDHAFSVPLDHARPDGERLELHARELAPVGRDPETLPWLLYLEGGPGFGARRFIGRQAWLDRALRDHRVLLLDQRGTGLSSPANRQTLPARGGPEAQAEHLAHFRADAIVADAEAVRLALTGGAPWSVLGQSFGGFCVTHYLSVAPEGLTHALITGGLPGLTTDADGVYRASYPRVRAKNTAHYARHPQDLARVRAIAAHLREHPTTLPGGHRLTVESFQSLGLALGSGEGTHALHLLLAEAFLPGTARPTLADSFLERVGALLSFAGHPLYALLQESLYAQDPERPTAWAAERIRAEHPAFDADLALDAGPDTPVLFTGETIHPWHFSVDPALAPLRETAEALAHRTGWTPLYDPARLAANEVPVAAAIYHDDMYVDTADSLVTARTIRGLRTWVTDEYEHDGLRTSGGRVLDRLLDLVHDR
ncbi:alpha/beta fold hydrolase [Streptomyces sp. BI20]|uniref:alpha/beta fold hydrolase n=1 Tax=Streptomyces sp. BI20 TaxID=3403460 RepID=UPI003C73626F